MKERKVSIQGIKGSFHHQAAREYFQDDVMVDECLSFNVLTQNLLSGKSSEAVMAIENSIAGAILPNYALVGRHNLCLVGEHYLNIHHNLLALPGQKIEEISEVSSHPMALLQCSDFLEKYPHIRLVEDVDTADVARRIQLGRIKGTAAIASKHAAQLYDLEILAEDIHNIHNNSTRFVILRRESSNLDKTLINKASLRFNTQHKRGSLATILNVMSDCRLNLTKIQSLPVIETPWKYSFYVDVTFDDYLDFDKAKKILPLMADHFQVLGEYKNARL